MNSFNSDGSFAYTPNNNFRGIDYFTYKVNDGTVDGTTVRANIVVGTGFSARHNSEQRVGGNDLHAGALQRDQPLSAGLGLIYRSDYFSAPIVTVDAFLAPGTTIPNSITATLTFGGVAGTTVTYSTSGMSTGTVYRFAVQAHDNTLSLSTGMHDWTLVLTARTERCGCRSAAKRRGRSISKPTPPR